MESRPSPQHSSTASGNQSTESFATCNEDELAVSSFLSRLHDSTSDEEASDVAEALSEQLRQFQEGRISEEATKAAVAHILVDVEPKMVEEFISVHLSSFYRAWSALPQESLPWLQQPEIDARIPDLEGGLELPPEIQRKDSSQSSSPVARQKGVFSKASRVGSNSKPKEAKKASRANGKGPRGSIEWQAIAKRLIPEGSASYATWFTITNVVLILGVFAYMAGDYAVWVKENQESIATSSAAPAPADPDVLELIKQAQNVPQYLKAWLTWRATWQSFSFDFLRTWGGRWAPALERGGEGGGGAWWLWVTSMYIHQNLNHITANLLLLGGVSMHLEVKYGWWRMLLVWFVSGIGSSIISAVFEPNCKLLVGASGAVFGFFGLFMADLVVNFESTSRLLLRVLCVFLFTAFFIVNAAIEGGSQGVSHASHVGGLICGLFPSLLFLPNIRNKRIRALKQQLEKGLGPAAGATSMTLSAMQEDVKQSLPASCWTSNFAFNPLYLLGGLVVIVVYIFLPIYLYTNKLKSVCCKPDIGTDPLCPAVHSANSTPEDNALSMGPASDAWTASDASHSTMFRQLLGSAVLRSGEELGGCVMRWGSVKCGSGEVSGLGADPWGHLVAWG